MSDQSSVDLPATELLGPGEQRSLNLMEQAANITARLGHDLRGPLHLVAGYADLLSAESSGPLSVKQKQFIEFIRVGAKEIEAEIGRSQAQLAELIKTALKQ